MSKVTYEIVEHDGGWAYRVNGVFSETFTSHDAARQARQYVQQRNKSSRGDTTAIEYGRQARSIGTRNCRRAMTNQRRLR